MRNKFYRLCVKKPDILEFIAERIPSLKGLGVSPIHLVVASPKKRETIPQAMPLVAGRTALAYNMRKGRKGAFWQDRYHATAIETGDHLQRFLVYVDLLLGPCRRRWVQARSALCFLAVRERGITATELAGRMGQTQPAIGLSVKRGEATVRKTKLSIGDLID